MCCNVEHVKSRGPHSMQNSIQSEAENGEGPVRFVGFWVRERKPPEVVGEDRGERGVSSNHERREREQSESEFDNI